MDVSEILDVTGEIVEIVGVMVIIAGAIIATVVFAMHVVQARGQQSYAYYRRSLGRSILLGLEFLIAGDIIRTVATQPTFEDLGVLAIIVAIRTFLSLALEVEIDGTWPWARGGSPPLSED